MRKFERLVENVTITEGEESDADVPSSADGTVLTCQIDKIRCTTREETVG